MTATMQETPCLRYPEALGMHRDITIEFAINMLNRGISMAQTVPFSWGFVDKPGGTHIRSFTLYFISTETTTRRNTPFAIHPSTKSISK